MDGARSRGEGSGTFLVEQYRPGITVAEFSDAARRVCALADDLTSRGRSIRYRHSTLVIDDEAAFSVLDAESMNLIEEAFARAGVRYERIVRAVAAEGPPTTRVVGPPTQPGTSKG
jgi:hypothetical protein